jgi:hypothetical protein
MPTTSRGAPFPSGKVDVEAATIEATSARDRCGCWAASKAPPPVLQVSSALARASSPSLSVAQPSPPLRSVVRGHGSAGSPAAGEDPASASGSLVAAASMDRTAPTLPHA